MVSLNRRLRHLLKLPGRGLKAVVMWLLRVLMISNRPDRLARAGFVLPTTALLLLMLVLTAGALTYRSASRSQQTIAAREQKVIVNAATPAVDRAKAKLEYLFDKDDRLPPLPSSDELVAMLLNDQTNDLDGDGDSIVDFAIQALDDDVYTIPGETRIDINGDGINDNAWVFNTDINGDGTADPDELVAYSIIANHLASVPGASPAETKEVIDAVDQNKALALVTRTGPFNTSEASDACRQARNPGEGWQLVNQSGNGAVQKNFQVDAFVVNRNEVNRTVETLEFQQAREAFRGSKWGAWFRYDLEWHPGPTFNWNGAMHTEGNLFVVNDINSHMISTHNSCLYGQEASEISLGGDDEGTGDFQGQLVRGTVQSNNFETNNEATETPIFHLFAGEGVAADTGWDLGIDTDSVVKADDSEFDVTDSPADIAMNPIKLYTEDVSEHIVPPNSDTPTWKRAGDWDTQEVFTAQRVFNETQVPPFVDDFFRADNRWGPKPRYSNRRDTHDLKLQGKKAGEEIGDSGAYGDLVNPSSGLDGYWERQAIQGGLRLIVGERLELGNAFGWNFDPIDAFTDGTRAAPYLGDPLYPADTVQGAVGNVAGGPNEIRQRRSLRDNLAAVQSMAVYHYEDSAEFPKACLALTVHPGTLSTIINSRTFETYVDGTLKADFLNGVGTNGWEFQYPAAFSSEVDFDDQIADDAPLGIALRNLAHFAGDPYGGAPSFLPVQDTADGDNTNDAVVAVGPVVHPYPDLSMWGDYASLRRVLDKVDGAASAAAGYDALSPADKTTLHTAACTLSMLAYQLNKEVSDYSAVFTDITAGPAPNPLEDATLLTTLGGVTGTDLANYKTNLVTAIDAYKAGLAADDATAFEQTIDQIRRGDQIIRDRALGFKDGGTPDYVNAIAPAAPVTWDQATGNTAITAGADTVIARCDPNIFDGLTSASAAAKVALAVYACADDDTLTDNTWAKYPSLYYLFPLFTHDYDGDTDAAGGDGVLPAGTVGFDHFQPPLEEYIADSYVAAVSTDNYEVVSATPVNALTGLGAMAAVPGAIDGSDWALPIVTTDDGGSPLDALNKDAPVAPATTPPQVLPDDAPFRINLPGGGGADVAFLDKAFYDGRENLNVRALDIDIKTLTNTLNVADYWISADIPNAEGIVYAFREDTVREDEVVRPSASDWATCSNLAALTTPVAGTPPTIADCQMDVYGPHDPPLDADNSISPKPVDYYVDPDHRANGFRLRNGADFKRPGTAPELNAGMTLVTDNPVYIQGNFNLHSTDGAITGYIEEFDEELTPPAGVAVGYGDDFYTGRTTNNVDDFANLAVDHWRPVEILTDAITILSDSFRDGAVEDGFLTETGGTLTAPRRTSYLNQNRPYDTDTSALHSFVLEDGTISANPPPATLDAPVWVDRNGVYRRQSEPAGLPAGTPGYFDCEIPVAGVDKGNTNLGCVVDYITFSDTRDDLRNQRRIGQPRAVDTYVNAVFVSNIIPSRANQGYGGFHNYPRLLEFWGDEDLVIAGAFLQLGFSNTSTGPYDQDAWEPTQAPDADAWNVYYEPPVRKWGYDVGLQYVPPAPVSRRFVTVGSPRSEYYRELAADDPYVMLLRCAKVDPADTDRIDPAADDDMCPY